MNRLFTVSLIIFILPFSVIKTEAVIKAEVSLNSELTRCAAITRDLQRLACYDALSGLASSSPVEALSKKSRESIANKSNKSSVANQNQNTAVSTTVPTQSSSSFGLKDTSGEGKSITSYIPGDFRGWKNGDKITLANGQVWKIKDPKGTIHHVATNPKVTISKGVFGSYRINIEGLNKSASVKRIK